MLNQRTWQRLTLRLPPDQSDLISLICWETDSLGSEESPGEASLQASFYYPEGIDRPALEAQTRRLCRLAGVSLQDLEWSRIEAPDDLWTANFREHFRGVEVGEFFVRPPWIPRRQSLVDIQIDPSHAFGTGTHESTQLILERLPEMIRGMGRLLDIGTGSGILALAARRIAPASSIIGIDIDPEAILVAAHNRSLNGIDVTLVAGGSESIRGRFDLVVANLTCPLLLDLAGDLNRLAAHRLVVSGFTIDESQRLEERLLAANPWGTVRRWEKRGWMCCQFEKLKGRPARSVPPGATR